jgi:Cu(I)/Ag(I) efflux system membrane fusion protein
MKKTLFAAVSVLAMLAACNNGNNDNNNENNNNTAQQEPQLNSVQKEQVAVFNHYIDLKNALVEAKAPDAAAAATQMNAALGSATVPTDSAWKTDQALMAAELLKISKSKNVDSMRMYFSTVSDRYYDAISKYGLYTKRAYREYCPMAFDNKGAYWLSTEEKIENPYYGHDMLECGEVRDTL